MPMSIFTPPLLRQFLILSGGLGGLDINTVVMPLLRSVLVHEPSSRSMRKSLSSGSNIHSGAKIYEDEEDDIFDDDADHIDGSANGSSNGDGRVIRHTARRVVLHELRHRADSMRSVGGTLKVGGAAAVNSVHSSNVHTTSFLASSHKHAYTDA